jgi:UDP-N-acetylmuramoyl-tripeptide--D-alanyl-D-alanine ligase
MDNLSSIQISNYLDIDFEGPDVNFNSISTDTRTLQPGALFIAIKGENFDGHDYINEAINKGAAGLIIHEDLVVTTKLPVLHVADTLWAYGQIAALYRSKFKIPMVAVTGSCGKTSVKSMIAHILQQSAKVLSPEGSYNNEIGLPKTLLELTSEHAYAVLEMGAKRSGDIKYLMELVNPSVTLINNVAPVHIESFGSLDGVAAAKGEIYEYLQPHGTAVVNVDDVYAPFWLSKLKTQNIITFGLEYTADITCAYIVEEHHRIKFELVTDIGMTEVILPLLGLHNVMNALAAAAAARALGTSLEDIKQGLETYKPVTKRMEVKAGQNGAKIIDDSYNANPVAMQYAIDVLTKQAGKKIMVIGDMLELGELAESKHKLLGQQARDAGVDVLLGFGILTKLSIAEFGDKGKFYNDKTSLIADLSTMLDPDTVVLIKGSRGMRLEEVVNALILEGIK